MANTALSLRQKLEQALDPNVDLADREGLTGADINFGIDILKENHDFEHSCADAVFIAPADVSCPLQHFTANHRMLVIFHYIPDIQLWTLFCWAANKNYGEYYDPLWTSQNRFRDVVRENRRLGAIQTFWDMTSFNTDRDFSMVEGKMKMVKECWSSGMQVLEALDLIMTYSSEILNSNEAVFPHRNIRLGMGEPSGLVGIGGLRNLLNKVVEYENRYFPDNA